MISNLKWEGGDPLILVNCAAAPEDYTSKEFQQAVVRLAANAGRIFPQEEPTADVNYAANFDNVVSEISSFRQQVAKAAKLWHSEVFTLAELADWPLRPILEWQTIETVYNPVKAAHNTATYWRDLNSALTPDISLDPADIRTWINAIAKPRNELIRLQPAATVDSSIIDRVLDPLIKAESKSNHKQWSMQAVKWEETYTENPSKLPWPTLKSAILKLTAKFEKDKKLNNPRQSQRPRLNPAAPTGMALTAQHDEHFQVVFDAAMAAASAAVSGVPQGSPQEQHSQYPISPHPNPSIVCDNCRGQGHIQMFCPSPCFTRQHTSPQQRMSRWERGGRGGGQPRGGSRGGRGGGSSGFSPQRGSGYPLGSGPRNSGFRGGMRGGAPFQGLRGGSHAHTASTENFLDVVQGDPNAGLIAYDPFDESAEWQDADQHGEDTEETALFAHPPGASPAGTIGRAEQKGQDFRNQYLSGSNFGNSPTIPWANLESQPALDAPPPCPPTSISTASSITEAFSYFMSMIWILPLFHSAYNTASALIPPLPRTPTAALSLILILSTYLLLFPPISMQHSPASRFNTAFVMAGLTANSTTTYLVDSGCTTSIICDTRFLRNFQLIGSASVAGLSGSKLYTWQA
mmetsp:Transcript_60338/g.124004  ORF Transcript_60338/g.124004 Transcript_60338/m.124004 type:complete len:631 (-) Transcript_60338:626-2518(-)